jgi:hypothetical protein
MFAKFWSAIKRRVVEEVPDEMSACLDCGELQCEDGRYATCQNRLRTSAALKAMRAADVEPSDPA